MRFDPQEILFLPSTWCNLKCAHCAPPQTKTVLPVSVAVRFMKDCKKNGIVKVGFTGGEIFLHPSFLLPAVRQARRLGLIFTFITTNAVWFKDKKGLVTMLDALSLAGYDGSFFVSIDAFHQASLHKAVLFVKEAMRIWQRPDIVSFAYVWGVKEKETRARLRQVARLLKVRGSGSLSKGTFCLKNETCVIRTFKVPFSAARGKQWIRDPWQDRQWFQEDYCQGPGNVLFVLPDGTVKPCCGYGSHSSGLTLGNIQKDPVRSILAHASGNCLVQTIFSQGLTSLRDRLHRKGIVFPGKTKDQCAFCEYIQINHFPAIFFKKP